MATDIAVEGKIDEIADTAFPVIDILIDYGTTIASVLYLIIGALLIIFLLQSVTARFIYPRIQNEKIKRIIRIFFGTLYVLVIVIMALLILGKNGVQVEGIAHIAIIGVLIGAVIIFLLSPFLPRLPFKIGHLVEINGILGNIMAITTYHTTIRTFDGTMAFIPNALVIATKIMNYSDLAARRVEIMLSVNNDSDLEQTRATFVKLMGEDERVLQEPPPITHVINVTASGVDMMAFCWVKNEDWFATRTDLWLKIVAAFNTDERIGMSFSQQEIFISRSNQA